MSRLPVICIVLAAGGAGCATGAGDEISPFVTSDKADGPPRRLRLLDRHRLHVDEPSDLAFVDGRLYTVSDQHSKIYEITPDGDVVGKIDVAGSDLEALTYDPELDQLLVADEGRARISYVDFTGEAHAWIDLEDARDGNSGIEGLAIGARGHLFVAKEKSPARIYELDREGYVLERKKIEFTRDLSALAYHPEERALYALGDQDQALFRLDANFDIDTAWRLPVKQPEGLAFDGNLVYVVSDSEERIYTFELD